MTIQLQPGDPAPPFALTDQHGETVRLEDYRGRKLLVYFYPEADTPGCTTQSCDLRDHRQEFGDLGVDVVGISPDMPDKQLAFDEKYGLGFPLLERPRPRRIDRLGHLGRKAELRQDLRGHHPVVVPRRSRREDRAGLVPRASRQDGPQGRRRARGLSEHRPIDPLAPGRPALEPLAGPS